MCRTTFEIEGISKTVRVHNERSLVLHSKGSMGSQSTGGCIGDRKRHFHQVFNKKGRKNSFIAVNTRWFFTSEVLRRLCWNISWVLAR
ncbi:hypothetical protein KIN20_007200 [Parelaphostrongylus tenuis]|uniref:Uncharacterized protein n=1 Tax=Parelaphostrongylus tenuis TaxID=148309 RepID=A0AAD5M301_PARTN|nr:hypothetical protein KIN20_007200 [Parelaphostrongylus tenuis]